MERTVYQNLLTWKEAKDRKPLVLLGARQVGKTYIVQEFGRTEYASFIYIDFYRQPGLKGIFDGEMTAEEIIKRLTAYMPGVELIPGDTLIFLDEIQCCGNARTAIKFLSEDMRFDVISSGSLMGLTYGENDDPLVEVPASVPVGYESQIMMFSLDFEEFLRTREKSLKTTVHYCPTVHGTPQTSMSFPPQSNVIYDPK